MTSDSDAARFADFYRDHYSLILTICYRRLGNRPSAEDATAEVFRIVWQRYSKEAPALPTLYAIARNVMGNEYQRATRARSLQARLVDERTSPEEADDQSGDVRAALLRMRPTDRDLLYMAYWEDLTAKEISEIVRISPGAVWVRLTRAREALRSLLTSDSVSRGQQNG